VPIWLIIILAVLVLLAVGGFVARRRQLQQTEGVFRERLEKVNEQLAAAHASDRGWDPQLVRDGAARGRATSSSGRSSTARAPTRTRSSSTSTPS
jgi:type II secretory pathway pseudopilin PulG